MMTFEFRRGTLPLLISIPHNGSLIPPEYAQSMTPEGSGSRDTDWFLDRLYDLPEVGSASWIIAGLSRYVIDLNRPADDQSLYPGQATTGLVPATRFDGTPIYRTLPSPDEIAQRVEAVWQPYHQQLQSELQRLLELHGQVVLWDAHSIAPEIPRLFEGRLPDFNLGTFHGASCDPGLTEAVLEPLQRQTGYSHVLNGRFVGGYITRHYGNPQAGVHAIQMELSQATYLDLPGAVWSERKVARLQPLFASILTSVKQWIENRNRSRT